MNDMQPAIIQEDGVYRVLMTWIVGEDVTTEYVTFSGKQITDAMHQYLGVPTPEEIE